MGSSVSVSDPDSEDRFKISIFGIILSRELEILWFVSGSKSNLLSDISIIGDKFLVVLLLVDSGSEFLNWELPGLDSVEVSSIFSFSVFMRTFTWNKFFCFFSQLFKEFWEFDIVIDLSNFDIFWFQISCSGAFQSMFSWW